MPANLTDRMEQAHALMMAARIASESLCSELGLTPGESAKIGDFILTSLTPSRSVPAIVSVALVAVSVVAA